MNKETFIQFLNNPSFLYKLSYQELKSLVVQYPYCQNLRLLLVKKSQSEENNSDFEKNLKMASAYSNDRDLLFQQVNSSYSSSLSQEKKSSEKALELKDLNTLDLEHQKEVLLAETEAKEETKEIFSSPIDSFIFSKKNEPTPNLKTDDEAEEIPSISLAEKLITQTEEIEEEISIEGNQITEEEEEIIQEDTIDMPTLEAIQKEEKAPQINSFTEEIESLFFEEDETPLSANEMLEDTLEGDSESNTSTATDKAVQTGATLPTYTSKKSPIVIDLEVTTAKKAPLVHHLEDLLTTKKESKATPNTESKLELEEEEIEIETKTISPQSSFNNWLQQFNTKQVSIEIQDLAETGKEKVNYTYELINGEWQQITTKVKKKKKKSFAEQIAAKSVKVNKQIATETLAQLLEKQEHYDKAIKIYERLSLEIPEKSEFFAVKIKELTKKL